MATLVRARRFPVDTVGHFQYKEAAFPVEENHQMKRASSPVLFLAGFLSLLLAVPPDVVALPQAAGQRAGQVDRLMPVVAIARGTQSITAAAKTPVLWQDVVNTQAGGRARIALDDGSVLNVGSESSLRIAKHDGASQQTDLELTYGKLRSQATKITQPNGKFEVRTAAGVAGVVGTDFYVGYENNLMTVIVYEGVVRVCNLAGMCVEVKAGEFTTVREGDNSPPPAPAPATPQSLLDAGNSTDVSGKAVKNVAQTGRHFGKGTAITLGILAVVPAVVVPIVSTRGTKTNAPARCNPTTQCP